MIRLDRSGNGARPPSSLTDPVKKARKDGVLRNEHNAALAQGRAMSYKEYYKSKLVKEQLIRISYGKCSYCDRRIVDVEHGDVEHFRPRALYWWLAYTWENLLYSCQICNQVYKLANFPIGGTRGLAPGSDLNLERPLLINPLDEDPEQLIAYDMYGDGISIIPRDEAAKSRVEACIDFLGINRETLLDSRREVRMSLVTLYALYEQVQTRNPKNLILKHMQSMAEDSAQCAGMIRFYLTNWSIPLR